MCVFIIYLYFNLYLSIYYVPLLPISIYLSMSIYTCLSAFIYLYCDLYILSVFLPFYQSNQSIFLYTERKRGTETSHSPHLD